jgi:hypothetical protein
MTANTPAYMISGRIVKQGLFRPKAVKISITDGQDVWEFYTSETFTVPELQSRFPYFNKLRKAK